AASEDRAGKIGGTAMKTSLVIQRSIVIRGHKTSVTLEEAFWKGLKEIARERELPLSELVGSIDSQRADANLSSELRLFALDHYRKMITRVGSASMAAEGAAQQPETSAGHLGGRRPR